MSWPKSDMFAITIDGEVLMNARAIDGVDLAELATKKGVFVGVVLSKAEVRLLLGSMARGKGSAGRRGTWTDRPSSESGRSYGPIRTLRRRLDAV